MARRICRQIYAKSRTYVYLYYSKRATITNGIKHRADRREIAHAFSKIGPKYKHHTKNNNLTTPLNLKTQYVSAQITIGCY